MMRDNDSGKLLAAAHYIRSLEPDTDRMKLEKLLYYVQGYSLAYTGDPLFPQEPEAWQYGPVYAQAYQADKHEPAKIADADLTLLSPSDRKLIEAAVSHYRSQSPWSMSIRTHEEAPWRDVRTDLSEDEHSKRRISHQAMMRHFSSVAGELPPVDLPDDAGWSMPSTEDMDREAKRFAELLERLAS